MKKTSWVCLLVLVLGMGSARAAEAPFKFFFGQGEAPDGCVAVAADEPYASGRGYGFDFGTRAATGESGCTSAGTFFFSVAVPEGNYTVTLTLGDGDGETDTTIKAEQRRLMLEGVKTRRGRFVTRAFTLNVRRPRIAGGGQVTQRTPANPGLNWDDKLTLEFNGRRPGVRQIEIAPAPDAPVIYLVGDSTVTDAPREPWNSWGQMLTRFIGTGVAVANYAESGRSLKSFIAEKRWAKVVSLIGPGDYLLIQMGHNDQKDKAPTVMEDYARNLKMMIGEARRRGARPVLVTSVNRRTFGADGKVTNSLRAFTEALGEVARAESVPLIDLNAMSKVFYEALGKDGSTAAFVDGTHHNNYGSYELAKCIVQGIRENKLELAKFIVEDFAGFDPARPDPVKEFGVPASPGRSDVKPEGK